MIARRMLLVSATGAALPNNTGAQPLVPYGRRLAFNVIRHDTAIGSHVLTFDHVDNGLNIHIAVDIAVGIGPLVLFRYTLRGLEQWRDGKVVHVHATTNDDGTPQSMRAERDPRGLWVEGSQATRYLAPDEALPATHWNLAELDGPWINPQDGKLLRPTVTHTGTHYVLSGDAQLEVWYDSARRWSALRFTARDGSAVRYELAS